MKTEKKEENDGEELKKKNTRRNKQDCVTLPGDRVRLKAGRKWRQRDGYDCVPDVTVTF